MNAPELAHVLLQHQGFLRALARRLVATDDVDDLAQETWVRALERPPRSTGSVSRWLRTVTRNLSSKRHRLAGGRMERERRVAREEALPGVDDDLAQAELLRSVLDAVVALDEPYRATILARYFRGQSAAEVANETHTPLATVRSREQRALARLRERLDRDRGGDRAAWAALLVRWVEGAGATRTIGPAAAPRGIAIAAGVGLVGLVAVQALRAPQEPQEPPAARLPQGAIAAPVPAFPTPSAVPPVAATASVAPSSGTRAALPTSVGAATQSPSSSGGLALQAQAAEVRGRILLPDGQPSIGQAVAIHWGLDALEQYAHQSEVLTEADGAFSFHYEPEGSLQVFVSTKRDGFAQEQFAWDSNAGLTVDLGDIVLRVVGRIEGIVVDGEGQLVQGETLEVLSRGEELGGSVLRLGGHFTWASVDPSTGGFVLEDLPQGRHELTLRRPGDAKISTRTTFVTVLPGATTTASAVWAPPTLDIQLVASSRPIFTARPAPETIHLSPAASVEVNGSSYLYSDLPPGPFTLEIDDPRFVFWQQTGVQAGDRIFAHLQGSSTVGLDVRDASGQSCAAYSVAGTLQEGGSAPERFDLHAGPGPLTGGRLEGLVSGSYELRVTVPELGTASVSVPDLAPGETRSATVAFEPAVELTGLVTRADGSACAGVEVLLLEPAAEADSASSRILRPTASDSKDVLRRHQLASAWTDASGAFGFGPLQPGRYALHASEGFLETASAAIEIGSGGAPQPVELVLPAGGTLAVTLQGFTAGDEPTVTVVPRTSPQLSSLALGEAIPVAADGTASIGPRPAGEYRVDLGLPAHFFSNESWSNERVAGWRPLGSVVLADGETTEIAFDVTSLRPGTVSVQVLEHGAPGIGLTVGPLAADGRQGEASSAIADADGRVTLPAFPGDYVLRVSQGGRFTGSWIHQEEPDLVHVIAGGSTSVVVDFAPDPD